MKMLIILFLLLLLVSSAFGELTKDDLRTIIKEEITASEKRIKEYIDLKIETVNARIDALDKNLNDKIDAVDKNLNDKIDAVDKNLNDKIDSTNARIDALDKNLDDEIGFMRLLLIALIGLIAAAIVVPQIIIEYRSQKEVEKRRADFQTELRQLREKIEVLENTPS